MIKDYQTDILQVLVKLEQGNLDVSDYAQKFNGYHNSFRKTKISEKFATCLYIVGFRFGPLRAELISAYSLE